MLNFIFCASTLGQVFMFSASFSLFLFVSLLSSCVLHQLIAAYISFSPSVCRLCPSLCMSVDAVPLYVCLHSVKLLLGKTLFSASFSAALICFFFLSYRCLYFTPFIYVCSFCLSIARRAFLFLPSSLSAQGTLLMCCSLFWLTSANVSEVYWLLLYYVTNIQLLMRYEIFYIKSFCFSFCLFFSYALFFVPLFWLTSATVSLASEWISEGILSVYEYLYFLAGFC